MTLAANTRQTARYLIDQLGMLDRIDRGFTAADWHAFGACFDATVVDPALLCSLIRAECEKAAEEAADEESVRRAIRETEEATPR